MKKNPFDGKTYTYDSDDVDYHNSDMFNEQLHDNAIVPTIDNPLVCGYCQTCFLSRNKLFYHLGYIGVDVRKKAMEDGYEKRKRKYHRGKCRWDILEERREKKQKMMDLEKHLNNLRV